MNIYIYMGVYRSVQTYLEVALPQVEGGGKDGLACVRGLEPRQIDAVLVRLLIQVVPVLWFK